MLKVYHLGLPFTLRVGQAFLVRKYHFFKFENDSNDSISNEY